MKETLYQAMGDIRDDYIQEAIEIQVEKEPVKVPTKMPARKKWRLAAACLLILLVGVLGYRSLGQFSQGMFPREDSGITVIGGIERRYKNTATTMETAIIWPWEYMTVEEKYNGMTFEDENYRTRASAIDAALLEGVLGTCTVRGYDIYSETTYTETYPVRKIRGISSEKLVAVEMEGAFYVYLRDEYALPATWGQMMDLYSLSETVELERYSAMEGFHSTGYYEIQDDDPLWQVLETCRDAQAVEDSDNWDWGMSERNYLSFTVTSEALGVYKRVLYITEDGYLKTNMMEYGYLYDIGTEAAQAIISYAREHSTETRMEPYEYRLAGTLAAVEEGYALIDDSILCQDPEDGIVFKVPLEDIRVRRCVEFGRIEVGDIVVVSFRGDVDVEAGYVIGGATSMDEGFLSDGHVLVPE